VKLLQEVKESLFLSRKKFPVALWLWEGPAALWLRVAQHNELSRNLVPKCRGCTVVSFGAHDSWCLKTQVFPSVKEMSKKWSPKMS
jgi:hypothetical protein